MLSEKEGHEKPRVFIATVDKIEIAIHNPLITGAQLLREAGFEHIQCHTLYQKLKGCDFEKVAIDEVIDLSNEGVEHFITKGPDVFNYEVNNEPETTDKKELTPIQIMELKGVHPSNHYLIELMKDGKHINYAYRPDKSIQMICAGMKFITEKWLDTVVLEEYGKKCISVPPSRTYIIKIDKNNYPWHHLTITRNELIRLETPVDPSTVEVYKFLNTSPTPVKVENAIIDLTEKCLIRFVIQPKDQQDGRTNRRAFTLPEEDTEFLDQLGLPWEAIAGPQGMWIIIYDYPIPIGYNVQKAEVAMMIAPNYPAVQIDMACFYPHLSKLSGTGILNILQQPVDNKTYQCWSRHRKSGEWKPGVDNISTHLCLVDNWLLKDLGR